MRGILDGQLLVRGELGRKLNNALTMTFTTGPEQTVAHALQSAGDGAGGKLGVLFGFKNGGPGKHSLEGVNGAALSVQSREQKPTIFREGDTVIAEAERGAESVVRTSDGAVVFTVIGRGEEVKHPDAFQTELIDATGESLAFLDVIRTPAGWSLGRELVDDLLWFGHAGQPLKIPLLGTSLVFHRVPTVLEGNLSLGVCVDLAIGLRPYVKAMN